MNSNSPYQVHQQQHQPNSGLLRFHSAPTSVLHNFKQGKASSNGDQWERSEPLFRFLNLGDNHDPTLSALGEFVDDTTSNNNKAGKELSISSSSMSSMNSQQGYSTSLFSSQYPRHDPRVTVTSSMMVGSMKMDQSAAHFPNNFSFHNGFDTMKGAGNYGGVNDNDGELSLSMNRMKNQIISFSSRSPSSSFGILSQTSKMGVEDGRQEGNNGHGRYYGPGFPYASWNETSNPNRQRISNDDSQKGELSNQAHTLSHHLSLPRTSSEMFAMDNLLQFTDSVPCKIRAKRGFATHPRSIAERVRRTRISERIRKLQELVPNMEKQTNTSEMLDLAVTYIKNLQKQFKNLSEKRAKCKCINTQKSEETDQAA